MINREQRLQKFKDNTVTVQSTIKHNVTIEEEVVLKIVSMAGDYG